MHQSSLTQSEEEIPWEAAGDGVTRQIYGYDDQIMMVKIRFSQNAAGALHHHPHTQVTYVESGVFELTISDRKKIIKKGDGFRVPPNALHGVLCLEAGMLIDVFSPLREDFLQ